MLIPGIGGQMEVVRFHSNGGLPDSRYNCLHTATAAFARHRPSQDQPSLPNGPQCVYNIRTRSVVVGGVYQNRVVQLRIFSHGRRPLIYLLESWRASAETRYMLLSANSVWRARERDRRQVFGHKRARPPAALTWF